MSGNDFVKGRTNNHLTWVMVDATDFATPESALSAATKIKIWGKLRGQAAANFVSSGTGSLTNDIQHVGPSILGMYTIACVKADLSDASAAWYDQYEVSLSATGAAYQTLIVDGGIDASVLLQAASRVLVIQSMASDAVSAAAQANSRVLLVQSRLSDFDSRLVSDVSDIRSMLSDMMSDFQSRVPKAVATQSLLSDVESNLRSILAANADASDVASAVLVELGSYLSDILSAARGVTATLSVSDISDIASAVWANTIGARVDSRVLVAQSYLSDIRSHVSDLQSDFQSRVPKRVATDSQLSDMASDVKSADVESNLLSFLATTGVQLNASTMSDLRSAVAAVTVNLTASDISDIASAVLAGAGTTSISASDMSDIASRVWAMAPATALTSRMLVVLSAASDIYSLLSDHHSDFQSRVPKLVANNSQLSDLASDVNSAIGVANSRLLVAQSVASDIYSLLSDVSSDLGVISGVQSDIYSAVSDLQSDFQSRVPKRVATDSQLSALASDIQSQVTVGVNVKALNNTTLNGNGTTIPWGP